MSGKFHIKNKVAIVTGAVSGIGLSYTKQLLKNGAKGVTVVDVNETLGNKVIKELEQEFGGNRVIFVRADVADIKQFEDAFLKTIDAFKNVDILINNAGIADDSNWEKEIAINLKGVIHGVILGIDKYLPKYKQEDEAVILNTASIAAIETHSPMPVYTATKHGVVGLTKAWGTLEHYEETKVRVLALCPGATTTPLVDDVTKKSLGPRYTANFEKKLGLMVFQEPDFVAEEAIRIIEHAKNGSVWIIDESEPCYEYIVPDRATLKKNILKY